MLKTKLVVLGLLAVCAPVSFGKEVTVTIDRVAKVGGAQLQPGLYRVEIGKSDVVFVNSQTNKSVKVPAKIETGNQTFRGTMLDYSKAAGDNVLKDIEVGGSKQTVQFETGQGN